MPKPVAPLSARAVATLKEVGMHADGAGLYLNVTAAGTKKWIYRFQLAGRRRDMGLGPYPAVSLQEARAAAADAKKLVVTGIDPIEQRDATRAQPAPAQAGPTFKDTAERYMAAMAVKWRNKKHASQWPSTLNRFVYPIIGDTPISDIGTTEVLAVLTPIWTRVPETSRRVRGRIEVILNYAKAHGDRTGENPANWKGTLEHLLPAQKLRSSVKHHPSLPYDDIPAFMPRLLAQDGFAARALELIVLTASRTTEALGATWAELDLDAQVWTIPAERMKPGYEHRVPLSRQAMALLTKMAAVRLNVYVFPGAGHNKPLSNMAAIMALRRMCADVTPHGFRSTFRTWIAEKTAYPHELAEVALSHTQRDKVVAAYQRGDMLERRRKMMQDWADYCFSKLSA